ncbi:MAG: hypothetical protein LBF61_03340 [Azoarcus sp.]|jgi:hypothetical protein|nr:hypothetical protein [Azoarcus sp.]
MATVANTPTHIYLDTSARKACDRDIRAVERACRSEPEDKDGKARKKKKEIAENISRITDKLDSVAKGNYKKTAKNAWMDDHCSGLWAKAPQGNKFDATNLKNALEEFQEMGVLKKLDMLRNSLNDMVELAKEILPENVVSDIVKKQAIKIGVKTGVGAVLAGSVVVPVLMAAWTAYDLYDTAKTLAALMGDKGTAALKAFESILGINDKMKELLDDITNEPAKAYTNLMSLLAMMDACIRARKCMLVKYKDQNDKDGTGCCPGQTGHHIIPDSAVKDAGCPGYNKNDALVMCLEGSTNHAGWGTHGNAHANLQEEIRHYRKMENATEISYNDMAEKGIDAVRRAARFQCDKKCLRAQLDRNYNCEGKTLSPSDGTGRTQASPKSSDNVTTR